MRSSISRVVAGTGAGGAASATAAALGGLLKRRSSRFSRASSKPREMKASAGAAEDDEKASNRVNFGWRRWDLTRLGEAVGGKAGSARSRHKTHITVMSYNVLADYLMKWHEELYREQPKDSLEWEKRWPRIRREIQYFGPDVLCLQEVQVDHFDTHFAADLRKEGYEGLYKQRTGDKRDGCAIFFRRDKFRLVDRASVEYFQPGVPVLDRDNVGLLVKLRPLTTESVFVVATTHLLYNPKRQDVKLAQLALLFAELDRFTTVGGGTGDRHPCIVTGDFNFNPDSPLYQDFIERGDISYGRLLKRPTGLFLPPEIGITDRCKHADLTVNLPSNNLKPVISSQEAPGGSSTVGCRGSLTDGGDFGSGRLGHNLNLRSAYKYGPRDVTSNQHNGHVVVDYMLYSTVLHSRYNRLVEGNLKLLSRLRLPTGAECVKRGGLPSRCIPSDHISLVAKFLLMS